MHNNAVSRSLATTQDLASCSPGPAAADLESPFPVDVNLQKAVDFNDSGQVTPDFPLAGSALASPRSVQDGPINAGVEVCGLRNELGSGLALYCKPLPRQLCMRHRLYSRRGDSGCMVRPDATFLSVGGSLWSR
jgi:hypothetical protein